MHELPQCYRLSDLTPLQFGRPAITLPQPPEAMEALVKRAQELQVSSFHVVPPLSSYPGPQPGTSLQAL